MSSVDAVSNPVALQIAQQNQKSAFSGSGADKANSGAELLSAKLNEMYGSDGSNKAGTRTERLAARLGVDAETLLTQMQGKNAAKVNELVSQATLLESLDSGESTPGTLFDSRF